MSDRACPSFPSAALTRFVQLCAALSAFCLASCSKSSATSESPAPEQRTLAAEPAPSPQKLKVGFMYFGPIGDHGWTYAHELGRRAMMSEYGDRVESSYVENVPESTDSERVMHDLIEAGNQVVFGTGFGYMEPMLRVAASHENVKFEHNSGYKTAPNLRTYHVRTYETAYLAGVTAGLMTTTNTLGFVGSFPIPEVLRNIDSYTLGALSVNPKVTTKVVWIGTWFDPPKETAAAQALMNQGADVLLQNTDSSAVLQAADKAGKYAFGWNSDMSGLAEKAHLGSCFIDWGPYYKKAMKDLLEGSWRVEQTFWGMPERAVDFIEISERVPAEAAAQIERARQALQAGTPVWKGPIADNTGKLVLAEGQVADDDFLQNITFYVKGVEGKIPR